MTSPIYSIPLTNVRIYVCRKCLRAACWRGKDQCPPAARRAKGARSAVEKTFEELEAMGLEHPSAWALPPPPRGA